LPYLGIDSYHVENNKCSSFAQVFPDFGNIDGVVKAVDTDQAMQRMRNAQGFLEIINAQVFPDIGNIDGVVKAVDTDQAMQRMRNA
jgi:L-ribulose-5-phosphate 3-epimerase UlaE